MIRGARNLSRLVVIAWTLARYDALQPLAEVRLVPGLAPLLRLVPRRRRHGRIGERLAEALRELGPAFIKFGQALSTRADLVGETVAEDLAGLRDRLPPFPAKEARAIIALELDREVAEAFTEFIDEPVAAASIAQVHFAVTSDGDEVAVKVLRPGIEQAFARDIDLFQWLAERMERAHPAWRRLKPVEVVRVFAESVRIEMDLRFEAAAASELAENFAGDSTFRVPTVDWRRTAQRVLTTERVRGIPIHQRDALIAAGHDLKALVAKAAAAVFNQVFRDGFFHADLHPGNLFVDDDGAIVAVDFGIMGRIDRQSRRYLAEMLLGFLIADYDYVADVHFRAGYVPADQSREAFAQACRSIGEPILGLPANEISVGRLLGQLFQVTETFRMEVQPHLLLLQKTMMVAEGVGRRLDPTVNMWQLAQPLIEDWVNDAFAPQTRLRETAANLRDLAERLPRLIENFDRATSMLVDRGYSLHIETVYANVRATERPVVWLLATVILLLLILLAVMV